MDDHPAGGSTTKDRERTGVVVHTTAPVISSTAGAQLPTPGVRLAWAGSTDRAFELLDELLDPGRAISDQLSLLEIHPFWDPLRGDPRFERLLERLREH